jgi:hypothetical protein
MLSDLVAIKKALLDKHRQYEVDNPDEYREGVLGGIAVALSTIDRMMESEDQRMAREYDEK